jgi:hypothetical protein
MILDIKLKMVKNKKKKEQNQEIYGCYYSNNFQPTTNQREYEKHVVLYHTDKPAYPSLADLKNNITPRGKNWKFK